MKKGHEMSIPRKIWNKVWGIKEIVFTSEELEIINAITDALSFEDTTIDNDIVVNKYYVENQKIHLTLCVNETSNVIQFVNTNDNVDKKFREDFIQAVIDAITGEKHIRMEKKFERLQIRSADMFKRIGKSIRDEKKRREDILTQTIPTDV